MHFKRSRMAPSGAFFLIKKHEFNLFNAAEVINKMTVSYDNNR
jgi:hypothetical protein